MNLQMHHNSETGELEIFSSVTGESLLTMTTTDILFAHSLDNAFRKAEKLATIETRRVMNSKLNRVIEEISQGY